MEPWTDSNRFHQNGYSSPTIWPCIGNYAERTYFLTDYQRALEREESRTEWLDEQDAEARLEWLKEREELKAEREDY